MGSATTLTMGNPSSPCLRARATGRVKPRSRGTTSVCSARRAESTAWTPATVLARRAELVAWAKQRWPWSAAEGTDVDAIVEEAEAGRGRVGSNRFLPNP